MWPHLPLEEKPSCWISWVYRGANITNILCLFHTANVSILCLLTVGSFPLFLGGNPYFPNEKYGLPEAEWLEMWELISIKVITPPWLHTRSTASLPPWLSEAQMGSLRTAHHPNPAAMFALGRKRTVRTPHNRRGSYSSEQSQRGLS